MNPAEAVSQGLGRMSKEPEKLEIGGVHDAQRKPFDETLQLCPKTKKHAKRNWGLAARVHGR